MDPHDTSQLISRLALELQSAPDREATARTVIDGVLAVVPDADLASLTVHARGGFVTLACSSDLARQLDQIQYDLDEGPCVDAASGEEWLRSGDVGSDPRWRRWGPRAVDLGARSMLSVRLSTGQRTMGALNIYARDGARFANRDEVDFAVIYAAHTAVALASAEEHDGLHTALHSRHTIGVAQGRLMERYGLTLDQSFNLLRRYSSTTNTPIRVIAKRIVDTGRLPEEPRTDGVGDGS